MERTAKLEYGPLEVEIHALNDEDYQKEVLDLIQFIEDNQESLDDLKEDLEPSEMRPSKSEVTSLEDFTDNDDRGGGESQEEAGPLSEVASELRVSASELERFLHVAPGDDDLPVIYTDEVGDFGKRKTDRQRVGSLILLYLWHKCYSADRVKSTMLKDALELSSISAAGMGNMYQGQGDRYFDRAGRGPSATVRLTPPGKRQARKILKRLVEDGEAIQSD